MLGLSYRYILTREVDSAHSTMALMSNAIVFQCVPEAMHAFRVSSTIPSHCGAGGINKCSIGISLAPHRAARRQTTIPVNSASHCTSSFTTFKAAANYDGLPVTQIVRRGTGPILVNCHPRLRQATRLSTGSKITDSSAPSTPNGRDLPRRYVPVLFSSGFASSTTDETLRIAAEPGRPNRGNCAGSAFLCCCGQRRHNQMGASHGVHGTSKVRRSACPQEEN